MTRQRTTPRARRARIMVVGEQLADDVRPQLQQPPLVASSMFEAIGMLATCETRAPITAALLSDDLLSRHGADAVQSLRRVDPTVQIVAIGNGDASFAGIDGRVRLPVQLEDLAALVGEHRVRRSDAEPANGHPARRATPERDAGAPRETSPPPKRDGDENPAELHPTGLGDTDLIDAVMNEPGGVLERAIALIRQQTGWFDVTHHDGAHPTADLRGGPSTEPSASVAIAHDGRSFGYLHSRIAGSAALEPWAGWIGRWLSLDAAHRGFRAAAYRDDLTGAWNRRYFNEFLHDIIEDAQRRRRPVTVMVFDLDDFKRYNDEFSHEAGDVILCETVSLLTSVIRGCDRVCRIGGDEFAVIFADLDEPRESGSAHPASVEKIARRFQAQINAMRFPKLGLEAPGVLSISAGLATFPWDAHEPKELLRLADHRALESKRRGKNHITFGTSGDEPGTRE